MTEWSYLGTQTGLKHEPVFDLYNCVNCDSTKSETTLREDTHEYIRNCLTAKVIAVHKLSVEEGK
ncbi:hypothetical protein [uncultured Arcobacter sp.]|uniref:hypothetical protein n=1 Tax=uncultured Arcobacter sp. TaxID=165434 RepID=UPI0026220124|nr:hypothetical protein [uncultured Arcobacter sp.]